MRRTPRSGKGQEGLFQRALRLEQLVSNERLHGAGLGFKPAHFTALMAAPERVDFIEIHAENYLSPGGLHLRQLAELRQRLPLSIHGVGLSLGGMSLNAAHLRRIAELVARFEPESFSEHLAWSGHGGRAFPDLLPMVYRAESLQRLCEHVDIVQCALGRAIAIENPSLYLPMAEQEYSETGFLGELCRRTGCSLLLDLNNVEVSAHNLGYSPHGYLAEFPLSRVSQLHVAGHSRHETAFGPLLIDDHGDAVSGTSWSLLEDVLQRAGALPTTVEWDNDIPEFGELIQHVDGVRQRQRERSGLSRANAEHERSCL